ncbi:MAG: hypothetical protein H0X38_03160 [Planctomycetes bacterium]|nr:hypothetical protein [Planctomycetota bacterium]
MPALTSSTAPKSLLKILGPVIGRAPRRQRFMALRGVWQWMMAPIEHEPGALRRIQRATKG